MNDRNLTVDVYSDVVCPWCYVGKRRLERALAQVKDELSARVTWRPFQLNPTMPAEGVDRAEYLEAKFGSLESFRRIEEHVRAAGEGERISFAFDKITRTPNTFLAHRLIWFAQQQGVQDAVVDALFRGYFEEGADIGAAETLEVLTRRAGLEAGLFLRSETGVVEVRAEEAMGHRLGIRSVPYFVFNDAYAISGAQPPERFVTAMRKIGANVVLRKAGG